MPSFKARILLLSAYDAQSHKQWREGLVQNLNEYQWHCLSLPARYFSWRIRGNALSWGTDDEFDNMPEFDLIIATSMVDLATLVGLKPQLAHVPSIVYFHENQFAYPESAKQQQSVEPQLVNLYSALAANKVVFNSQYNRETFFLGVQKLLKKLPDCIPAGIVDKLQRRSGVLAVPIALSDFKKTIKNKVSDSLTLVWNHRWEYDKGPKALLALIRCLDEQAPKSTNLTFHIVGQQFRSQPEEFNEIQALLKQRSWMGKWGFQESKKDYLDVLKSSDVVLSTALHDFQGLSIFEGIAQGCSPVLPERLAYPNFFDARYFYRSSEYLNEEAGSAAKLILSLALKTRLPVPDISAYSWRVLTSSYKSLIESTLASTKKL